MIHVVVLIRDLRGLENPVPANPVTTGGGFTARVVYDPAMVTDNPDVIRVAPTPAPTPPTSALKPPSTTSADPDIVPQHLRPTAGRRRLEPKGSIVGKLKKHARNTNVANAVHGSKDTLGRVNYRGSKLTADMINPDNPLFHAHRTSVKFEDIDFDIRFRGMTREEIEADL